MSEISVRLPDGKLLAVPAGTTVLAVAERIGPRLARAALAGRIDGRLVDLRAPLDRDVALEIVTARDPQAGEVIRHSAEHVMADAVKRLFPSAQIDVGRSDHGEKFQYDFLVERPFSPQDLERIEDEMRRILAEGAAFEREVVDRAEAKARFAELGEHLKVSRIDDIPAGDPITIYRHGSFQDLCRGPHVQRAGQIGAVKLIELAGAYWRGDERNPMLQRIYGTAFASAKELDEHLERLEEARRRDHRRVGQDLDLFHLDPLSPGSPFFHPKGVVLFNELVGYVRSLYPKYGFQEIITPQIFRSDLFKISGHYENFGDDMFRFEGDEDEELFLKPMNCPGHCVYYNTTKHSYRDLPLRFAEFTRLHRNERSGTLHGLSRVRSFAQDDAHVFCMPEQVESELRSFFAMLREIYHALGLDDVEVSVSTRPEKFIGNPEAWDHAEKLLIAAVEEAGYACGIKPGEAVFYAPKVECDFRDVMGRVWTLGTVQVDMSAPDRFGLSYVGSDGQEHRAAMLHRAILGSLERFIAIYLEHTGGDFPLWLSPVQVAVLPIAERHTEWGARVRDALAARGLRVRLDDRNEKLNFKIREAETHKIPVMAVVGDQEVTSGTVTPRRRRGGKEAAAALPLDAFVAELSAKVAERRP
ncbi:threonine--tRNA ligase [Myxococcota bacterium]|nr:threonine--tRNA ligase [Myxococcota bacterium]MCZ7619314.1 threonine--tRNA ligase [Myxococcota bacterium]